VVKALEGLRAASENQNRILEGFARFFAAATVATGGLPLASPAPTGASAAQSTGPSGAGPSQNAASGSGGGKGEDEGNGDGDDGWPSSDDEAAP
jgi:hypothetical protein